MGPNLKNVNILIADDDRMTRTALRLLLSEQWCNVVGEAVDGEKALEMCIALQPDIAFIDINMPKMDGHQAAQSIRSNCPNTGVIMISTLPTLSNVQQAMQAGANAFVVKPFNTVKVIEAIEQCLRILQ